MGLTNLEVASGWVSDVDPQPPPLQETALEPFEALEKAVLPALRRPPCVVSFSGGVDSSLVLAAATEAARSEGLPLPVPVTLRFPHAETEEESWQETVIRFLGLTEWVRIEMGEELDLVGPIATEQLRRHGLLWPPNAHFHVPIFEQAQGGAALTGYGGDHLLSGWPWRRNADVLSGRTRPAARDLARLGFGLAPSRLRRRREARRVLTPPWLTAPAAEAFRDIQARVATDQPRPWSRWLRWQTGTRRVRLAQASLGLLGADRDVAVGCPLLDPLLVSALMRVGRTLGLGDRRAIVNRIASTRLPVTLLERSTKARFTQAFFASHSKSFAARCDNDATDHELVRLDRLRQAWSLDRPPFQSALLLQRAWLSSVGQGVAQ